MSQSGIHQITAVGTDPVAFVGIAAETGCRDISMFTQLPGARSVFPLVTLEKSWQ